MEPCQCLNAARARGRLGGRPKVPDEKKLAGPPVAAQGSRQLDPRHLPDAGDLAGEARSPTAADGTKAVGSPTACQAQLERRPAALPRLSGVGF